MTDEDNTITQKNLDSIRNSNMDSLRALQVEGAMLDPVNIVLTRINTLLDCFLNEEDRVQFEYLFETRISELLRSAHQEVTRSRLLQGVQAAPPSSLYIPGK